MGGICMFAKENQLIEIAVSPLSQFESKRGTSLTIKREYDLINECLRLIRIGYTQKQIGEALGASKSRVSRWSQKAVLMSNCFDDRKLVTFEEKTLVQRLFDRMGSNQDTCWIWQGSKKASGYGSFAFDRYTSNAHRIVYETFIGKIKDGFQIDHICCNPSCVNPKHLQQVLPNENMLLASLRRKHA